MNIHDIVKNGQRLVLHSDDKTNRIYTWNGSLTLQVFEWNWKSSRLEEDNWDEVDAKVLHDTPLTWFDAQQLIKRFWNLP